MQKVISCLVKGYLLAYERLSPAIGVDYFPIRLLVISHIFRKFATNMGDMKHHILIVEDDLTFATMLKSYLGKKGYLVDSTSKVSMACSQIEKGNFDLVLTDLRLPDKDGTVLLPWMREKGLHTPIIIMTRYADIRGAVQAMKDGAADYIAKPMHPDELLKKIQDAIGENAPDQVPVGQNYKEIAANNTYLEGESEEARRLYNYVALVAPTSMSVLITGASGTGKEFVAHRIHEKSNRSDKPFFAIDCGAIPEELAASEFFGHIKGSFTGALTDKVGAFEAAHGGTLFLDEVENLSYKVQVQLLRAIQERQIRKIGSNELIPIDVRLREDLYHRINEFSLNVPNLCDRGDDILLFANFFLDQANQELNKKIRGFTPEANKDMKAYSWPGNLRQLKNTIMRAVLLAQADQISPVELNLEPDQGDKNMLLHNAEDEKKQIEEALRRTGNHKSKAALLLGIDRKTLYNKMKLYKMR